MRGRRIGEAATPGPDQVRLLVANVTRWSASWRGLLQSDAAVWLLQEARIPSDDVESSVATAAQRGLRLRPGPVHEGIHLLATAHRHGHCQVRAEPMRGLSGNHPGRLQHVALHLGPGRVLRVLNCYGYAGGRGDLERNAALVLEGIEWLRGLGGVPALLVGDLDCKLHESGLEGPLAMAGWRDLLAQAGPTCLPSQGAPSRIDYVLANREALGFVERAELRWDLGLATHCAMEIDVRVARPERVLMRRAVAPLDGQAVDGWGAAAATATTAAIFHRCHERFHTRLQAGELDAAWDALSMAMRLWLSARMGQASPPPRPHAAASWRAERPPCAGGSGEAAHAGADAALLRLRRLRGLRHAQNQPHAEARGVAEATLRALRLADASQASWRDTLVELRADVVMPLAIVERAEADWRQAQHASRSARRQEWGRWVQDAAANERGRLFRWIRGGGRLEEELVPDPLADSALPPGAAGRRGWVLALRGGTAARLRFFELPWQALWQRQAGGPPGEDWLRELDGLPPFPARTPWTAGMVRALLRKMPRRKKPGLDAWTVAELRLLPDALLGWIAELFEAVEARGAWPQHLREPEGLLLPKPDGGGEALDRRPIWLLPILYRLWAAGRAQLFARWRLAWAGDDVRAGAEELAWELALELEAAEALEEAIAGQALDWRKAYDHVCLATLPHLLDRAGVPSWLVQPALSAYTARRRLRVGQALGEPWEPTSGILPGCALAVFFLSVLTLPWLRRTGGIDDRLRRRIYVDDFTVWMRGDPVEVGEAVSAALELTLQFEHAMDWRLNRGKSAQFANTRALRQGLRQCQPEVPARTCVRDLGVVAVAGPGRRCAVGAARLQVAIGRFARIGRLPLPFKDRCLLGAAAGTAAGLYGAACGRPPRLELVGLRAAARQAACRGGLRNAAELVFGILSPSWRLDPEAVVVLAPLWRAAQALRRRRFPAELWRAVAGALQAGGGRRNGPLDAAMLSMSRLSLGADIEAWTGVPSAPQGWRPAERALQDTRRVLLDAWTAAECSAVAARRADFVHLQRGIDRWASRLLLERGALAPDAAGALRVVLAGGTVTESVAAKWGRPARCPHCGDADEDLEHRLWQCPRWESHRHAALAAMPECPFSPATLRQRLARGVALTGTLPLDARLGAMAEAARHLETLPRLPPAVGPIPGQARRRAWTDGACVHPTDPLLARAGWGLLLDATEGVAAAAHQGAVDGFQTAQRAELLAALMVVSLAVGPVEVITDSRFVANGVAALGGGANPTDWSHCDLWEAVAPHCRSGHLTARWVKGHTTPQEAASLGLTEEDRMGNAEADRLAGEAATARLPPADLLNARAGTLMELEAAQRVLAAVELAALRANHGADAGAQPRVRRRRPYKRRSSRPHRSARALPVALGAAPPAGSSPAAPGEAARCAALFAGRAWQPHAAAQGPGHVVCLRCGEVASAWPVLSARPCSGWASSIPPRAAAVLLLDPLERAGGAVEEWRALLERRLRERPGAPD